jgi:hypothetical protein
MNITVDHIFHYRCCDYVMRVSLRAASAMIASKCSSLRYKYTNNNLNKYTWPHDLTISYVLIVDGDVVTAIGHPSYTCI